MLAPKAGFIRLPFGLKSSPITAIFSGFTAAPFHWPWQARGLRGGCGLPWARLLSWRSQCCGGIDLEYLFSACSCCSGFRLGPSYAADFLVQPHWIDISGLCNVLKTCSCVPSSSLPLCCLWIRKRYPLDVKVLEKFNLKTEAGQKVVFCGSSGSGKTSTLSLLQRFYKPEEGSISLGCPGYTEYLPRCSWSIFDYTWWFGESMSRGKHFGICAESPGRMRNADWIEGLTAVRRAETENLYRTSSDPQSTDLTFRWSNEFPRRDG